MSLIFFADHCISNKIIDALVSLDHCVYKLRDYLPTDSPDQKVINTAFRMSSILISLNGDFTDIVTYPPDQYSGIISLQIKNHPEITNHIIDQLATLLSKQPNQNYYKGKLFIIEPHRIRIRT